MENLNFSAEYCFLFSSVVALKYAVQQKKLSSKLINRSQLSAFYRQILISWINTRNTKPTIFWQMTIFLHWVLHPTEGRGVLEKVSGRAS